MNTDVRLHFFCGKMAAGKSTLARKLALQERHILLVEDQWLQSLYPEEITTIADYIKYAPRLKALMVEHVILLLKQGLSVVMDFPANTVKQRAGFRGIFQAANVAHTLHFIDRDDAQCKQQLRQRCRDLPAGAPFSTDAEFDTITRFFEPPTEDEGFNILRY